MEESNKRLEGKFLAGSVTLIFMLGYLLRPGTVTSDRSGYWISVAANNCLTISDCIHLGFPSGVFGFIRLIFPFHPNTTEQWDLLLAIVGWFVIVILAFWVSKKQGLLLSDSLLFLAMSALSSMYIYMLSKDVIQVFIFLSAYLILYFLNSRYMALFLIGLLFLFEGLVWRPYYCIVAVFLFIFVFLFPYLRSNIKRQCYFILALFVALVFSLLLFSFVMKLASPGSYVQIVDQHGVTREDYTSVVAASGIKSVIPVSSASPVPLFVVNWAINIVRLLFPVELFLKGPYYWVFAIYQIFISFRAIRTAVKGDSSWKMYAILAVYFSFVVASGAFEPDFGSWVRHETAAFPFLISVTLNYIKNEVLNGQEEYI